MDYLPEELGKWSIKYYKVLPAESSRDSQVRTNISNNIVGLIYGKKQPDIKEIESISYEIDNIVLIYAHLLDKQSLQYQIYCFYNGKRLNIISYSLFSFIAYLYDLSVLNRSVSLILDNSEIEVSTYPDRNYDFNLRVRPPKIIELDIPLYEVLESLSINGDILNTQHKICILESPFDRVITIPVNLKEQLKQVEFKVDRIVYNAQKYGRKRVFPSFLIYAVDKNGERIDSRYINTKNKIFECPASPVEATMLHYFLYLVEKQLSSEKIHHYQGGHINSPTRFITQPDHDYADMWTAGGKCLPIN